MNIMLRKARWIRIFVIISSALCVLVRLEPQAWANDYLYVTNIDSDIVSVIDADQGAVIREVKVGKEPCDIAVAPSGDTIAVSHEDRIGDVWFLDRKTLKPIRKVLLAEEKVRKTNCFFLAFSKDGRNLYAVNQFSGSFYAVDSSAGKVIKTVRIGDDKPQKPQRLQGMVLSPDGKSIYIPDSNNGKVLVLDAERVVIRDTIHIGGDPFAVNISPDGKTLYVADAADSSLILYSLESKAVLKRIPVGIAPMGIAVSNDGAFVFVSNKLSYSVTVIDARAKEPAANIPVGAYPIGIVVSPDGKRVYAANYNENNVSIIDTGSMKEISRVPTTFTPVNITLYGLK